LPFAIVPQGSKLFFGLKSLPSIVEVKLSIAVHSMVDNLTVITLTRELLVTPLPPES